MGALFVNSSFTEAAMRRATPMARGAMHCGVAPVPHIYQQTTPK